MANDPISIEYGRGLAALEQVVGAVTRPGTFFACGRAEVPMPRLMVEGVGQISFPVSASQAREIMAVAQRAPYGRGTETVVDTSVRKVWQLSQETVKLEGKAWDATLASILGSVCEGLGCKDVEVSADLKCLVSGAGCAVMPERTRRAEPRCWRH